MSRRSTWVWAWVVIGWWAGSAGAQESLPPKAIAVLPIFFVPKGEEAPTADQSKRLLQHLELARTRYGELLPNQETFTIAEEKPRVYRAEKGLAYYRTQPENAAPQITAEMLAELKVTRFNCPYVMLVVVMNKKDEFPVGGGRPLNGGFNTGGAIIVMSTFALDRLPNFQSTLQHELGHSFGLPHVDVYGYDLKSNDSIMSYNPKHHTKGLTLSKTPGKLNPEDLWGLSLNRRAFPKLKFDPKTDVPAGYQLAKKLVPLGPMTIPGHANVTVATDAGEEYKSKVGNIVQGSILPSVKTGQVTFDASTMWQSSNSKTGWVTVQVTLPYEVELTRLGIHSQHSGEYHATEAIRVSVKDSKGKFQSVLKADLKAADGVVTLPKTKGRVWQLEFQADKTCCVVIRGIQFYSGDDELFPPLIPR